MEYLMHNNNVIYSPDDLIRVYTYYNMGHFFDKDTMRFFKSKVTSTFKSKSGTMYFVTSEKKCFNDETRVYTIRKAINDGSKIVIDSVSDFGEYNTLYQAKKILKTI